MWYVFGSKEIFNLVLVFVFHQYCFISQNVFIFSIIWLFRDCLFQMIFCDTWFDLVLFTHHKKRKNPHVALLKVTVFCVCFSRFLNCTNGSKTQLVSLKNKRVARKQKHSCLISFGRKIRKETENIPLSLNRKMFIWKMFS